MSEKIYAWLLRLYPSHFREAYGAEALQLFRDRSLHERGFLPSLNLWLDLLADLVISVPRQHRCVPTPQIGALARPSPGGTPSFHVLDDESLRLGALLLGGALSLVVFGACSILINHAGRYRPINSSGAQSRSPVWRRWFALSRPEPQRAGDAQQETIAYGLPQLPAEQPRPQDAARAMVPAVAEDVKLDAAERQRLIHGAIANLKRYYISPNVAQKMADALLAHEKGGDYDAVTDAATFADLLTNQMREVSHDRHLVVEYSKVPMADRPPGPPPGALARYRTEMEQHNCTFESVEILPHNVGYLKLNSFPDPSLCQPTAVAAMASLNHVDTIIFDLRDNGGGYPSMVSFIAAYLFDHPEYLYNPRENTTEQSWTRSPVPGNRLADKPVYVLTSSKTFSGAEQFSYDLKMLNRATLVGETTRGGAHAGSFHRIDDHFGMGIPETRAINPFSKTDWEGTGVEPDVKVKAEDALVTAEKLGQTRLQKK